MYNVIILRRTIILISVWDISSSTDAKNCTEGCLYFLCKFVSGGFDRYPIPSRKKKKYY